MILSSFGIKPDNTFNSVVFPDPVPPEITQLKRDFTAASINRTELGVRLPKSINCSTVKGSLENFRIVKQGPTNDIGGITALTRDPSGRRAST